MGWGGGVRSEPGGRGVGRGVSARGGGGEKIVWKYRQEGNKQRKQLKKGGFCPRFSFKKDKIRMYVRKHILSLFSSDNLQS